MLVRRFDFVHSKLPIPTWNMPRSKAHAHKRNRERLKVLRRRRPRKSFRTRFGSAFLPSRFSLAAAVVMGIKTEIHTMYYGIQQ